MCCGSREGLCEVNWFKDLQSGDLQLVLIDK